MILKKRYDWILYVIFTCIMIFVLSQKENFHEDELLSYNLANASGWFKPTDGVTYTPASEPFMNALVADGKFNLSNVWTRQSNDVHPPFYYILVHGICTLFPGTFSVQYLAIINIVFQLLIFAVLRAFLRELTSEEKIVNIISVAYMLCPGVLSITTFLRMYVCVIFWILLFTYLLFKNMDKLISMECILIAAVTVCGALTHYYFIIYAFCLSVAVCLMWLKEKRMKEFGKYVLTMSSAGGVSILIFPAIIEHMFFSGRGVQSIENLKSSNIFEQMKIYFGLLDKNLFGGIVLLGILFILLSIMLKARNFSFGEICNKERKYICLLLAILGYFVFIAKSAPMNEIRYLSPMFGVIFAFFLTVLFRSIQYLFSGKKYVSYIYGLIILAMLIKGWHNYDWEYLYKDTKDRVEYATMEGNQFQGICIYNHDWTVLHSYREISQMKSIIFYMASDYETYNEKSAGVELEDKIAFFIVGTDANVFLDRFMEEHPGYKVIRDNGKFKYAHSIYLGKE